MYTYIYIYIFMYIARQRIVTRGVLRPCRAMWEGRAVVLYVCIYIYIYIYIYV